MKGKMQGLQDLIRRTEQHHLETITELSRRNRELEIMLQRKTMTHRVHEAKDILEDTILKDRLIRAASTTPLDAQDDLLYSIIREPIRIG